MRQFSVLLTAAVLGFAAQSCGGTEDAGTDMSTPASVEAPADSTAPADSEPPGDEAAATIVRPWVEEDVTFDFETDQLHGVVTLPPDDGPHPAIVLVTGSVTTSTGVRDGVDSRALIAFAHAMTQDGYAVLRYDPPGIGRSTGDAGVETIDARAAESMAALHFLQTRPDIRSDDVGLWGVSQGSWVILLAAAEHPMDVAFIISVSGAGISVADQQVWGIESQSRAAGLSDDDVAKAALLGRLLIDWQLTDPIYRDTSEAGAAAFDPGPLADFAEIVYGSGEGAPLPSMDAVIEILEQVQDEPWADAVYLTELYLPRLRAATPEQAAALSAALGASLLTDPKDYMTRVTCPVLAFFGEHDIVQPSATSAARFEEYLAAAGNDDVTIVIIPDVGHDIGWSTPGYSETVSEWLRRLAQA